MVRSGWEQQKSFEVFLVGWRACRQKRISTKRFSKRSGLSQLGLLLQNKKTWTPPKKKSWKKRDIPISFTKSLFEKASAAAYGDSWCGFFEPGSKIVLGVAATGFLKTEHPNVYIFSSLTTWVRVSSESVLNWISAETEITQEGPPEYQPGTSKNCQVKKLL